MPALLVRGWKVVVSPRLRERREGRTLYVRPDRLLLETYRSGASVRELAALFSRNEGAIRSRLKKKGIL